MFRKYALELWENIYAVVPDFNKVVLQIYWNHTSAWVFSCKFAGYLWNTFPLNSSGGLLLRVAVLKFVRDAKIVLQSTAHFFVVNFKSIFQCLKGMLKGKVRSFQKLKRTQVFDMLCYTKIFLLKNLFIYLFR